MIRTEPAQVKYTTRLKSAQCCLCCNLLKKAHSGHTGTIELLPILETGNVKNRSPLNIYQHVKQRKARTHPVQRAGFPTILS